MKKEYKDIQDYDGIEDVADMLDECRQTGEKTTLVIDEDKKKISIK